MKFEKPVTEEEAKVYGTNASEDTLYLTFSMTEMTQFLMRLGYEIHAISGKASVSDTESDGGGSYERVGRPYDKEFKQIIAKKPSDVLPDRLDSDYAHSLHVWVAFRREMKAQMLRRLSAPELLI